MGWKQIGRSAVRSEWPQYLIREDSVAILDDIIQSMKCYTELLMTRGTWKEACHTAMTL